MITMVYVSTQCEFFFLFFYQDLTQMINEFGKRKKSPHGEFFLKKITNANRTWVWGQL